MTNDTDLHRLRSPAGRTIRIHRQPADRAASYPRELLRALRRKVTEFALLVVLRVTA